MEDGAGNGKLRNVIAKIREDHRIKIMNDTGGVPSEARMKSLLTKEERIPEGYVYLFSALITAEKEGLLKIIPHVKHKVSLASRGDTDPEIDESWLDNGEICATTDADK